MLANLIRDGNLGPLGLASKSGGGFTPCAFGGVGMAVSSLVEAVLTAPFFLLSGMLEIGLPSLVETLAPVLPLAWPLALI